MQGKGLGKMQKFMFRNVSFLYHLNLFHVLSEWKQLKEWVRYLQMAALMNLVVSLYFSVKPVKFLFFKS